jgi:D-glycero-D-manno-heptose 1,7-bisphosphate phosphatase
MGMFLIMNLKKMTQTKALFLDRDGVINIDHGYVHSFEKFDFIDGIFELTREASSKNYKIIVITNQAGIARGYYSEQQFHELTKWMCAKFLTQGVKIANVYFSPYHPTAGLGGYKKEDFSRKPNPGMILQAQKEFNLSLENSILIGDKESDIQAGISAGVGLNLLFSKKNVGQLSNHTHRTIPILKDAKAFLTYRV